jgi:hypothetical protein
MFGLRHKKLPVREEDRLWVDAAFCRLSAALGWHRMLEARVMLPTADDFPDRFDGSEEAFQLMFARIAIFMGVDPSSVDIQLFSDATESTLASIPFAARHRSGPGGVYMEPQNGRKLIAIHPQQLRDPLALVAVIAHELGHVILLGGNLIDRDSADMEPVNDLLTVFLGFGIFNANAAFQFSQYTSTQSQGWSAQTLGYLPEQVWGYALARFAFERKEENPAWAKFLSTSIGAYFKSSNSWLKANGSSVRPIDDSSLV